MDWSRVYLLGWYGSDGKPYLSTWEGDKPYVHVVVTGYNPSVGVPLWNAKVPKDCKMTEIPGGLTHQQRLEFAAARNGVYAFGWKMDADIDRQK